MKRRGGEAFVFVVKTHSSLITFEFVVITPGTHVLPPMGLERKIGKQLSWSVWIFLGISHIRFSGLRWWQREQHSARLRSKPWRGTPASQLPFNARWLSLYFCFYFFLLQGFCSFGAGLFSDERVEKRRRGGDSIIIIIVIVIVIIIKIIIVFQIIIIIIIVFIEGCRQWGDSSHQLPAGTGQVCSFFHPQDHHRYHHPPTAYI